MGFVREDLRNYVYLRGLLDAFEQRVIEYCSSPESPAVRFKRIKEIRNALINKGRFPAQVNLAGEYPDCRPGEVCSGMACVPGYAELGWPLDTDPESWDA
jgi:hypothetical protein